MAFNYIYRLGTVGSTLPSETIKLKTDSNPIKDADKTEENSLKTSINSPLIDELNNNESCLHSTKHRLRTSSSLLLPGHMTRPNYMSIPQHITIPADLTKASEKTKLGEITRNRFRSCVEVHVDSKSTPSSMLTVHRLSTGCLGDNEPTNNKDWV